MICAVVSLRIGCCEFYGSAAIVLEVQTFWDVMLYLVCVVPGVLKEYIFQAEAVQTGVLKY